MAALYKGFSSFEFQRTKSFAINDIDLVKLDILNHMFTRPGERVMMPNWGSVIPDLTFEPLDVPTIDTLRDEIERIVNFDPRVELVDLEVYADLDNSSVAAHVKLNFIEFEIVDNMDLNIIFEG